MKEPIEDRRILLEVVHRRRALTVNRSIFARRHGPTLVQLLAGAGALRTRCIGEIARLECEAGWESQDARRLAELADDIGRFVRLRPEIAEQCSWYVDRMTELVRQHAVLARLENAHRPCLIWPNARNEAAVPGSLRASNKTRSRRARA